MKFNFAIIGTAEAREEADLKKYLKIIMGEHLDPGNPALNSFTVLTGKEE